jgi:sarcosine oxidase, subunit gamma
MPDLAAVRSAPLVRASTALRALPSAVRYSLRGGPEVRAAAEAALGLAIPALACRAAAQGDERAALWLGPDEWLLISAEGSAALAFARVKEALRPLPHSLVDVSHRQCGLAITGPHATALLSAGCPLDLDVGAFPVGMCTRTVLAKAEVVLWRTAAEEFRLEVWRSFVAYVTQFLAEAARGII